MKDSVKQLWTNLSNYLSPEAKDNSTTVPSTKDAVEAARREWVAACSYFEMVSDPELVDHAIYLMEAAQRKYTYLLKQARQEGTKDILFEPASFH